VLAPALGMTGLKRIDSHLRAFRMDIAVNTDTTLLWRQQSLALMLYAVQRRSPPPPLPMPSTRGTQSGFALGYA